jgi:hypothetical protein
VTQKTGGFSSTSAEAYDLAGESCITCLVGLKKWSFPLERDYLPVAEFTIFVKCVVLWMYSK